MYLDIVTSLISMWHKPLSTRMVPVYGQFLKLDKAGETGLVNIPPMKAFLALYLALSHNHSVDGSATLPSKHCRFSASQLEKNYRSQASIARTLSSIIMLQTYQAMSLAEPGDKMPSDSPLVPLINEDRITTDHIFHVSQRGRLVLPFPASTPADTSRKQSLAHSTTGHPDGLGAMNRG